MRLIVEELGDDCWQVHIEGDPDVAAQARTPIEAAGELLDALRISWKRDVAPTIEPIGECLSLMYWPSVCRECGGSGRYVGLVTVEECQRCRGTGSL